METMKSYEDVLERHISKIVMPIFEKAAQEMPQNRMSVGSSTKISDTYSLYNPHNYRLYIDFNKAHFHPLRPSKPTYATNRGRLGVFNSREWKTLEQIKGCILVVKKSCVEIKNQIEPKRWFLIRMDDIKNRKKQIVDIHKKKIEQAKEALKAFIGIYGGSSEYTLKRIWCEEKIMKDRPIDKLPLNMFFKAQNVKKDYNEPNIEFYGDAVGAANYFSNRGIEDIAPELSEQLKIFHQKIDRMVESMAYVAENYKSHVKMVEQGTKVNKEALRLFKRLNKRLSQKSLMRYL